MKIAIYSDLHLEMAPFVPPADLAADVVVLAGDIDLGTRGIEWARRTFGDRPIVYVHGNHEFYGGVLQKVRAKAAAAAALHGVHLLDPGVVVINGVRFVGCTLWTAFKLRVLTASGLRSDPVLASAIAEQSMNDYHRIRYQDGPHGEIYRRLRPRDTGREFGLQAAWLRMQLKEPFDGPTVVVTHHAPQRGSLHPAFERDELSAAYINELDLEGGFFDVPALWIHGHTHTCFDYQVGGCRVVCNPRGYPMRWPHSGFENEDFDARRVIDV
ncbi:MAG: hypothetical protein RLZZ598_1281 [Pseudomonadota bacterium]|jgi:predicted phosphodiesterase